MIMEFPYKYVLQTIILIISNTFYATMSHCHTFD